jgi:hypothetical protein
MTIKKEEPVDTHTILLLHGDEFADVSTNNRPITYSNVSITNDGKFDKCFTFNTSTNSYLYTPNFNNFSEGNWTCEWWEYQIADSRNASSVGFVNHNNLTNLNVNSACLFTFDSSGQRDLKLYASSNGSSWDIADYVASGKGIIGQWVHRAIVREGQYLRCYQNGILRLNHNMENKNINTNFADIMMGNTWRAGFNGKICEFRLSDIARYNENFTPPEEKFS